MRMVRDMDVLLNLIFSFILLLMFCGGAFFIVRLISSLILCIPFWGFVILIFSYLYWRFR